MCLNSVSFHLYPTVEAVAEYNANKLHANGQPIAIIKAVHIGRNALKVTAEDAGGLESVVCLVHGARMMLCVNLWVDVGLVNGAQSTIIAICYKEEHCPPDLPVAVMVRFHKYTGPTMPDGTVPICPLLRSWLSTTHPGILRMIPRFPNDRILGILSILGLPSRDHSRILSPCHILGPPGLVRRS